MTGNRSKEGQVFFSRKRNVVNIALTRNRVKQRNGDTAMVIQLGFGCANHREIYLRVGV